MTGERLCVNGGGNEVAAVNTEVSGFNIAPMNSVHYTVCVFKNDADVRNIFPTCNCAAT